MGARTLEVRLSARLLVLAAVVLTAVGITTALVTDRALAVADDQRARDEAAGARDSLAVELSEGDSREQASREVVAAANGEGVRLAIQFEGGALYSAGPGDLPTLAAGQCANVDDEGGHPWRACCVAGVGSTLVAAVPVVVHRQVVSAVWRAMAVLVALATLLLWWGIRRAVRAPLAELTALVAWTARVRDDASLGGAGPPGRSRSPTSRRPSMHSYESCSKPWRASAPTALTSRTSCVRR